MIVKPYYCPNCQRFKWSWQVTDVDAHDFGNCKRCGTSCIDTEAAIVALIETAKIYTKGGEHE